MSTAAGYGWVPSTRRSSSRLSALPGTLRRMGKHRRRSRSGVRTVLLVALVVALAVGAGTLTVAALRPTAAPTGVADYTPAPQPTHARQPVVVFIGDSYSAGAGSSGSATRWTTLVSSQLGWRQNNYAYGGTGYAATAGIEGCDLEHCPTYIEAIAALDDDPITPDIIVISGGRNDGSSLPDLGETIGATVAKARSQWPSAQVVVTSPLWDARPTPNWFAEGVATVRAQSIANGATYLDLGQPLADHPELITEDDVHPNDEGHAVIAGVFTSSWAAIQRD